ncbi:MAG TPA: sigma-70 family RNA polymerase sigma factor [Pirellulales bacterium]|jgi:RNA polymerase sigma factor (sigma-70 family)|nr:sigma-70 family RNA polymerase sigma factor [Pirellulales bacterium]
MYRESALERLPDDQLLREASRGNTDALQIFCVKRLPSLLRYAKHQCSQNNVPIDLADDFCHDGILSAVECINDCKEHGHRPLPNVTAAWIKKIVANLIRDYRRRHSRYEELECDAVLDSRTTISPDELDEFEKIIEFFQWLQDNERDMLELVLMDGLSFQEAASRLNLTYWAGYKAYQRGLEHLRDFLELHGESVSRSTAETET